MVPYRPGRVQCSTPVETANQWISINLIALSGDAPYITWGRRSPMPQSSASRSARIEARIAPDVLAIVRRAAEIEGRSISDFVVDAARQAAEYTIAETQIIRLSLKDQERVAEILAAPPKPSLALGRAMEAHRDLFSGTK